MQDFIIFSRETFVSEKEKSIVELSPSSDIRYSICNGVITLPMGTLDFLMVMTWQTGGWRAEKEECVGYSDSS